MKNLFILQKQTLQGLLLSILLLFCVSCKKNKQNTIKDIHVSYPKARISDIVYNYFGTDVPDPYSWLEDGYSPQTKEWIKQENLITFNYLSEIPFRDKIEKRLIDIWNHPKESEPQRKGDKYFYFKNDGLQNQDVLYYKNEIDGNEIKLLDPNTFSDNGSVFLSVTSVSDDTKYIGYSISQSGSDWQEIKVRNIETLENLDDELKFVRFSGIAWYKNGFFYNKHPEPPADTKFYDLNDHCKIYYHKVGTSQSEDILIYEDLSKPELGYYAGVTNSKNYLVIAAYNEFHGNALYVKNLNDGNGEIKKIVDDSENGFYVIDEIDNYLYVFTNYNAPKYKIIRINLQDPEMENWEDFIEENEGVLKFVNYIGGCFIVNYLENAHTKIKIYDKNGKYLHDIDMDLIGSITGFQGNINDSITFYTYTSFNTPATIYKYDIKNNISTIYKSPEIDINTENYITKQVFFESKDGTKIPMFIVHKKDLKLNGNNPTFLNGYGGFGVSYTPYFDISKFILLEQGGVFVFANLRGGGVYGDEWHKAGIRTNKQNTFDDFIAAAEYLINEKYTSPKRLTIQGASNGGLVVGAVTNQRPELFAVALSSVPITDMLRYQEFTVGRFWIPDFGSSNESEEMFKYLYSYSPLHNIRKNINYPAILVTTSDHDERIVPAHSFKYIATLQNTYEGKNPILIRIESKSGLGIIGKAKTKLISEIADNYAFAFYNMDFTPKY
ncbi:MAG: prolyl oligopeptidase family serine peptidase [Bacteroidales bacterium]|jgi:prolyl oligopeptidase|nr:prolyl oligopeptidase family serine peptidase [Bacteroidales bacterium]